MNIEQLIEAYVPSGADLFRPLPTPSATATQEHPDDLKRRLARKADQERFDRVGLPRGL